MNTQKRLITPKNAVPRPTKDNSNNTDKNLFTSSVREAFKLMSTLIYPGIPVVYLDLCAKVLQKKHLETVFEERSTQKLCAFPPCIEKLEV
jgi:hypothetical protein